jgi:hypothetical protein
LDRAALWSGRRFHHGTAVDDVDAPALFMHLAVMGSAQRDQVVDVGDATVAAGRESYPLGESGPSGSADLDIPVLLKSQ